MSKRQYTKFTSEVESDIYIDVSTIESFEQEGHMLIIHKDSGQWCRIKYEAEKLLKLIDNSK